MTKVLIADVCRCCGCTAYDCRQCLERTGQPCSWADDARTLCTACVCTICGQNAEGPVQEVQERLEGKATAFGKLAVWCLKCRKANRGRYRRAS